MTDVAESCGREQKDEEWGKTRRTAGCGGRESDGHCRLETLLMLSKKLWRTINKVSSRTDCTKKKIENGLHVISGLSKTQLKCNYNSKASRWNIWVSLLVKCASVFVFSNQKTDAVTFPPCEAGIKKKRAEEKRQVCVFRLCLLFLRERLLRLSQRSGLSLDVSDHLSCVPHLQT